MDKILCFSNCKSLDSSTVRQSSHPILQHDTPIRCSSVQHRDLQRDDNNRFQRFHPKFAIDGNAENCWAGGFDGLQECWIEVVLPEKHVITSMSGRYLFMCWETSATGTSEWDLDYCQGYYYSCAI